MKYPQFKQILFLSIAALLCLFILAEVNYPRLAPHSQLALFAMLGLILVFLKYPLHPRVADNVACQVLDGVLAAGVLLCFGYVIVQTEPIFESLWLDGKSLGDRAGAERVVDYVMGACGLLLILEATRRTVGVTLMLLALLFLIYAAFGQLMPTWLFPHRGYPIERIVSQTFLHSQGTFGIALRVMFTYVFLFVLFGTLLERTGATRYILELARRIFGTSAGGPAKVAVLSSGMMGSLSGSAVANTATTGTFTIPLMQRAGFKPAIAGGIEAAASSGGALVPPIMGAGAYMMLEIVEPAVTYLEIIRAALLPAVLYYTALLCIVHFYAKRNREGASIRHRDGEVLHRDREVSPTDVRVGGTSLSRYGGNGEHRDGEVLHRDREVSPTDVRVGGTSLSRYGNGENRDREVSPTGEEDAPTGIQGVVFFTAFLTLIGFLLMGATPFRAVSWSLLVVVGVSLFRPETRLGISGILKAMENAAHSGVSLIAAAACVGIILGVVTLTGVGGKLPSALLPLASTNLILALLLLMISTIILGMGLPSSVCYLLMAILVGPVLLDLGVVPLAAHFFIFYFGMMSMVTPPVALAAYTASAIASSRIMPTAFAAFRFALVGFALPYAFVLRPELLWLSAAGGTPALWVVIVNLCLTLIGTVIFAAGVAGYAFKTVTLWERGILFIAVALLFFIPTEMQWLWVHGLALLASIAVFWYNRVK